MPCSPATPCTLRGPTKGQQQDAAAGQDGGDAHGDGAARHVGFAEKIAGGVHAGDPAALEAWGRR